MAIRAPDGANKHFWKYIIEYDVIVMYSELYITRNEAKKGQL